MIGVLFLCWISTRSALSQTVVAWTVGTPVPRFNEDLILACTVSADCCNSSARIWEDSAGVRILEDGLSKKDPKKYVEDWDGGTTGFNLIIKNLQLTDVGVNYTCRYSFYMGENELIQDATWEYPPTEQCPIEGKDGKLTGALIISRSAPSPSITATYGGTNVTSDLTGTVSIRFDSWFFRLNTSIDKKISCNRNDLFTLTVITGTTTTKICDNVDICKCFKCGGCYFGISCIGTFIEIVILILVLADARKVLERKMKAMYIVITAVVGLVLNLIPFFVGLFKCPCINGHAGWICFLLVLSGMITSFIGVIIATVISIYYKALEYEYGWLICRRVFTLTIHIIWEMAKLYIQDKITAFMGRKAQLNCPYKDVGDKNIIWCKINGKPVKYTEKKTVNQDLPDKLKSRLKVEDNYNLCITDIKESDAGIYECSLFGNPNSDKPTAVFRVKLYIKEFVKSIETTIEKIAKLPCPYKEASGQITWIKLNGNIRETYSEGSAINQYLPQNLRERLNVDGRDLCISNVKESDAGIYECVPSPKPNKVPQGSKLELIVIGDGKNRSTESGSPEKERADKKKDRKPTEVVRPQPSRPQPSRAQHLKTDNTGRAEYSTETEIYKPRPLPSISRPSDSPRPLPKRTPDDELEKGGIQLEPLVDSTSEKKKKKKRKKKETKQSDEEN